MFSIGEPSAFVFFVCIMPLVYGILCFGCGAELIESSSWQQFGLALLIGASTIAPTELVNSGFGIGIGWSCLQPIAALIGHLAGTHWGFPSSSE